MNTAITLMLVGMAALVMLNVPIAVALGAVAMVAIWIMQGPQMLPNTALVMFEGATNFPLLAVPLFILAGGIMNASSIARRLINLATAILGFVRGGLAMVTVGASMFFAEISGSAVADVAALGTLLIPAMKSRGYSKEFAAAVTSSSASLAIIIPPSIPMILYAAMAQESAVKLFVAGIIPGVIGGLALMALCFYYAYKYKFPVEQRFSLTKLAQALREATWALVMPVVILGGIFGGFVTATEGAAVAVLAALAIGVLIYRDLDLKSLYQACVELGAPDGRRNVAGGRLRPGRRIPDREPTPAEARGFNDQHHHQPLHGAAAAQYLLSHYRHVSAFGCGDHFDSPDRPASDPSGRHRSRAFRPGVDA